MAEAEADRDRHKEIILSRRQSSYWIARLDIRLMQLTKRNLDMGLLELT
jgi:hypothetical protein